MLFFIIQTNYSIHDLSCLPILYKLLTLTVFLSYLKIVTGTLLPKTLFKDAKHWKKLTFYVRTVLKIYIRKIAHLIVFDRWRKILICLVELAHPSILFADLSRRSWTKDLSRRSETKDQRMCHQCRTNRNYKTLI